MALRGGEVEADRYGRLDGRGARPSGSSRDGSRRLIVIDASIAVEILARTAPGIAASDVIADERLFAPAHFDLEVYGAFRRHYRRGFISRPQLDQRLASLRALAVERVALAPLLIVAHVLADALSTPDAFYVALAQVRRTELLTADAALARAAAGLVPVRVIG